MVFTTKNIREEAEVEAPASEDVRDTAIELVKSLLAKLEEGDADVEEAEAEVEVEEEACKESAVMTTARVLAASMMNVMESADEPKVKLEALAKLNTGLKSLIESDLEDVDGGLPEEAAENEYEEETCSVVGERKPTDVDVEADFGEEEIKESAADLILKILNK